jgi:hypothetical protein
MLAFSSMNQEGLANHQALSKMLHKIPDNHPISDQFKILPMSKRQPF